MTSNESGVPGAAGAAPAAAPISPVAIVAAHGDLAAGLVSAVEQITGRGALFVPLSNRDMSAAALEEQIEAHVSSGIHVVFTDLPAGSTTICARRLQRVHPDLVIVTGASLTALLAFALATDVDPVEAARAATEKARAALQVVGGAATPATGG
jgi:PTS system N-acetylgalactosamine-specific IIA component